MSTQIFENPFKPGAGHTPPYLAGREKEKNSFKKLLEQKTILQNSIITGLRGVGKTVLLESLKPIAISKKWLWAGTDLSESTCISEQTMAIRILTDLAIITSSIIIDDSEEPRIGFKVSAPSQKQRTLNFQALSHLYNDSPGLVSDKLKAVMEVVWIYLQREGKSGIIFAYDEAQNLADHKEKNEFALSLILDVFQSIQRKGIPFMLTLTGLPTLFPKLVEARTYSERMFTVMFLSQLSEVDSREAILKPIQDSSCTMVFSPESVTKIYKITGGYPFFIQFVCREIYDVFLAQTSAGLTPSIPVHEILRKLDSDFFAGRWAQVTDRQRELLGVIAKLKNSDGEFTVHEIVEQSKEDESPFSSSHVNQMLSSLSTGGLIYKNRHGKYSFAVPLLGGFITRQLAQQNLLKPILPPS